MSDETQKERARTLIEMIDVVVGPDAFTGGAQVEEVQWRIEEGSCWIVGGLQWAGKSALLATAAGIQRPMEGCLRLFEEDVMGLDERELLRQRRRVGLVFQEGGRLFNHLSVEENIALPICYHQNCRVEDVSGRVEALMEMMELGSLARRRPDRISRNWRQRVALARALALGPEVLLLDNPVTGLAPRERQWWVRMLAGLNEGHSILDGKPLSLVMATDDLGPWVNRGSHYAALAGGKFRRLSGCEELLSGKDPHLRDLLMVQSGTH